jgi:hypothetical protein
VLRRKQEQGDVYGVEGLACESLRRELKERELNGKFPMLAVEGHILPGRSKRQNTSCNVEGSSF